LVLYFPGPHSFTGEDVVELHCHGSRAVVQAVFQVLSDLGCRLAEPGEFTQRAWLSGKLDVLQIEALADLLTADTDKQRAQALQQLDGKLSAIYDAWREQLIRGLAHAEAVIDFGDDERLDDDVFEEGFTGSHQQQQENVWGGVMAKMKYLREQMQRQLFDQRRGELVREGVQIAIVGPPNAGKSSLFNLLADRDAAIVSPTAGTTRDVLELSLNLGGVKCILKDTAGVRAETQDGIELEGMRRAILAAGEADLVVAVVDSTEAEVGIDVLNSVLDNSTSLHAEHVVLVLNKVDLQGIENESSSTSTAIKEALGNVQHRLGATFEVSCITQEGIDLFLGDLTERVGSRVAGDAGDEDVEDANALLSDESALITRARHRQHVQAAVEALQRFDVLSQQGTMAVDMAAEELRLAASELGRITGAVDVEDVLDKLFSDFCIGK
jgi:tRNA modification GTPase